jgi:hypothetical protein
MTEPKTTPAVPAETEDTEDVQGNKHHTTESEDPQFPETSDTSHSKRFVHVMVAAGLVAGSLIAGPLAFDTSAAHASSAAVAGGITDYQVKKVNQTISLGSQAHATTLATKSVPVGRYLVTGMIGVNTQPGSFIVCAVSNGKGNDGVFGVFTNQWAAAAQENVHETEVVTVSAGQTLNLTCDDNNAKDGDVVGEVVLEALPVNALH